MVAGFDSGSDEKYFSFATLEGEQLNTAEPLIHGYVLDEERKASGELPQLLLLLSHRLQVTS